MILVWREKRLVGGFQLKLVSTAQTDPAIPKTIFTHITHYKCFHGGQLFQWFQATTGSVEGRRLCLFSFSLLSPVPWAKSVLIVRCCSHIWTDSSWPAENLQPVHWYCRLKGYCNIFFKKLVYFKDKLWPARSPWWLDNSCDNVPHTEKCMLIYINRFETHHSETSTKLYNVKRWRRWW